MIIERITTHLVPSDAPISEYGVNGWLILQVETDVGITGYGEAGAWSFLETAETAIERFEEYLIGNDPLRRDHHMQYLYRSTHFRGAAIMSALSAIDIALWDIAGKYYEAPIYRLLGGRCRDKLRTYAHAIAGEESELVSVCRMAKKDGFTAIGHLSPLLDEPRSRPYRETHAEMLANCRNRVERFREAVGTEVDLLIEFHRRLDPHQAVAAINEIESFHPFFVEDPIRPDNFDAMATVADGIRVPLATGERLHTPEEFAMLLGRNAVDFVRPDVCLAGGVTMGKKIAAMAEATYVDVVPHNPLGPICTAASMQLGAAIPNFAILEYPYQPKVEHLPGDYLLEDSFDVSDGYLAVPDEPGLGITINERELSTRSHSQPELSTRLDFDGSVVDQ